MAREQFQTLTEPMYYILLALTEECCGVDIMAEVEKLSGGRVKVGPGTLYAMLSRFEEHHVIRLTAEEGRRKSYIITELGMDMLRKEYIRLQTMVEDGKMISRFLCQSEENREQERKCIPGTGGSLKFVTEG